MMKKWIICLAVTLISLPLVAFRVQGEEQENNAQSTVLPILMYHHITENTSRVNKYTILGKDFENDVVLLKKKGYHFILTSDLIDYVENGKALPEKPIMITFDDGYVSFKRYAYETLKRQDAKALISIIGKWTDVYSESKDTNVNYAHLQWNDIRELTASPLTEVHNHTYDLHTNKHRKGVKRLPDESVAHYTSVLENDIEKLQNRFMTECGYKPLAFAYPFGLVSKECREIVKNMGFKVTFGCSQKPNRVTVGRPETMIEMNRFNRDGGVDFETFLRKIEKMAEAI